MSLKPPQLTLKHVQYLVRQSVCEQDFSQTANCFNATKDNIHSFLLHVVDGFDSKHASGASGQRCVPLSCVGYLRLAIKG